MQPAPVVAVVGGGQLARMLAEPAAALGVPLRLLTDDDASSAAQVLRDRVVGHHTDLDALRRVADGAAVLTVEHEHVPGEHLRALAEAGVPTRPGPDALVHAQDKGVMRERMAALGVPGPRSAIVADRAAVEAFGLPCVLKTTRGGYDGRGVWVVREPADADEPLRVAAEQADAGVRLLAEELVDFRRELSALVVRAPSGQAAAYPVVQSTQRDGICHEVVAPAPDLDPDLAVEAQQLALRVAGELDVTGVLAVELFETQAPSTGSGRRHRLLVNELAMRPHNTGHWTQDGAVTSQFENHLRAVLDLPLGAPSARERWTVMVNVLGSEHTTRLHDGYPHAMARDPRLRVHLYGKEPRPGRKLGHVNAYGDDLDDCLERARHAAAWFSGDLGDESE
ncbi:5-(carboxyamino)imidazole ribonucleotide synthase [Nocardioides marinquilinus]|uniref:N5-carboxyaminoimidazole ribonucleotide synthase n=1 Tax=Nocardioides marinquilinus TaxID=1210400 RepID=A0ABP9PRS8_9ACTN